MQYSITLYFRHVNGKIDVINLQRIKFSFGSLRIDFTVST